MTSQNVSDNIMQVDTSSATATRNASYARSLSSSQERKLVDYLDEQFLQLTRGYKKRSEPTTHLPTLNDYIIASRHILTLILQIPPIDPSTALRTAYLLRLTNESLSCITGYLPSSESLPALLDWLDDLDLAWLTVLQAQVWDPIAGAGVDLYIDTANTGAVFKSSPVSQTERTRLRSILVGSSSSLEEWLESQKTGEDEDVETMLGRLGLQAEFDDLFAKTLDYLGDMNGVVAGPS